jgi:ParB family chromosome partitioning protein
VKKPTGLGRGLSALIDDPARPRREQALELEGTAGIREIEVGRIRPSPHQPRKRFDETAIDELAKSISERGVLQPILLRPVGDAFELVAGERRWRAAQKAQLHRIPAIVRELDEESTAEIALIENVQREDLTAIEEAQGYRELIKLYGHTQEVVGKLVGKSRSHVTNLLRLLELPETIQQMLMRGDISMGHARAVAAAPDPESLAREIVEGGLSVRQAEERARAVKPASEPRQRGGASERPVDADLAALERQLGDMLGLRVKVAHGRGGGSVSLHYSSLDQLDMICQRLSGEPI